MSSIPWQFPRFPRFPSLRKAARERVRRWARNRQGGDAHITRLHSKRIYILPTGVGFVFALMTFAMLLGSMNYNNNLSFVLTFILDHSGVFPDDVQAVFAAVAGHRLKPASGSTNRSPGELSRHVLDSVAIP